MIDGAIDDHQPAVLAFRDDLGHHFHKNTTGFIGIVDFARAFENIPDDLNAIFDEGRDLFGHSGKYATREVVPDGGAVQSTFVRADGANFNRMR